MVHDRMHGRRVDREGREGVTSFLFRTNPGLPELSVLTQRGGGGPVGHGDVLASVG